MCYGDIRRIFAIDGISGGTVNRGTVNRVHRRTVRDGYYRVIG